MLLDGPPSARIAQMVMCRPAAGGLFGGAGHPRFGRRPLVASHPIGRLWPGHPLLWASGPAMPIGGRAAC
jgi:hypothetical protein